MQSYTYACDISITGYKDAVTQSGNAYGTKGQGHYQQSPQRTQSPQSRQAGGSHLPSAQQPDRPLTAQNEPKKSQQPISQQYQPRKKREEKEDKIIYRPKQSPQTTSVPTQI